MSHPPSQVQWATTPLLWQCYPLPPPMAMGNPPPAMAMGPLQWQWAILPIQMAMSHPPHPWQRATPSSMGHPPLQCQWASSNGNGLPFQSFGKGPPLLSNGNGPYYDIIILLHHCTFILLYCFVIKFSYNYSSR